MSKMPLSKYEVRSRFVPGLLALLPISIVILAFGLKSYPVVAGLSSVLVAFGGPIALATAVGNLGRAQEDALWKRWGGAPTTQVLRTRDGAESSAQRSAWREAISRQTAVQLPTAASEAEHPEAADDKINTAVGPVLYLGYSENPRHDPATAAENAAYGYERNLYALRWIGRGVSAVCLVGSVLAAAIGHDLTSGNIIWSSIVLLVLAVAWWVVPSEENTKQAGFRYARKLMQAVTNLSSGGGK